MTFVDWLSEKMLQRQCSQADLAGRSGVSPQEISLLFAGKQRPGLLVLAKVADALDLESVEVFQAAGWPDTSSAQSPNLLEWIRMFLAADEKTRDEMLELARVLSKRKPAKKKS